MNGRSDIGKILFHVFEAVAGGMGLGHSTILFMEGKKLWHPFKIKEGRYGLVLRPFFTLFIVNLHDVL